MTEYLSLFLSLSPPPGVCVYVYVHMHMLKETRKGIRMKAGCGRSLSALGIT